MFNYPVPFFVKDDVVYDPNQHILLLVTRVMCDPTLPIFKVLFTESDFPIFYNNGEMPLIYSAEINHLQYVCKISTLNRILRIYKAFHVLPCSHLCNFLRNFPLIGTREK